MKNLNDILDSLAIGPGDLIYVHSSFSRLKNFCDNGRTIIGELQQRVGSGGTIVFPSFSWNIDPNSRPWSGYKIYFESDIKFDVSKTPSNIGYLAELFRSLPGVRRSCNPFWSVCALGRLADVITRDQEDVLYPYGPDSSFGIMRQHNVKIIGLGVTLNTTSLCPIVDHDLGEEHPQRVFTDHAIVASVVNWQNMSKSVSTYTLLPEIVRDIKPCRVFEESSELKNKLIFFEIEESFFFSYDFEEYYQSAMSLAQLAIKKSGVMPWLEKVPLKYNANHY